MKITIISVGKLKEKYLKQAIEEYSKRLSKYCKLEIIEVPDEKAPETMGQIEEEQVKRKEGEKILRYLKPQSYAIALAIDGKELSSEALAETVADLGIKGHSHLSFIIGGSLGISSKVLEKMDMKLSFSKMTFPHQLMRVILLEQIYRSFRINSGEPYHK